MTFVKTFSWMLITFILFTFCTYYECGDLYQAFWSTFVASCIKTPLYGSHDVFWSKRNAKPLTKTFSWAILTFFIFAGSNYWGTGNIWAAVYSTLIGCIIKTPLFWIHEISWTIPVIEPVPDSN